MSPNARWRHTKIVTPIESSQKQELIGGLKNAVERGEPIVKAKQSFINAGYKQQEVEMAAQKISTTITPTQPVTTVQPKITSAQPAPLQSSTTTIPRQSKKLSKKLLIILITSGALILIATALLGIFWENLFG